MLQKQHIIALMGFALLASISPNSATEPPSIEAPTPRMMRLQICVKACERDWEAGKAKMTDAIESDKAAQAALEIFRKLRDNRNGSVNSLELAQAIKASITANGDALVSQAELKLAEVRLKHARSELAEALERRQSKR